MRHPAAVDVAGAVLVAVALAALALGAIAAVGRWPTEVAVAALSVATLSAAGALGLRIARAGHVVEVPVGPPTGEVPRVAAAELDPVRQPAERSRRGGRRRGRRCRRRCPARAGRASPVRYRLAGGGPRRHDGRPAAARGGRPEGSCVITLDEAAAIALFDLLGEWLG